MWWIGNVSAFWRHVFQKDETLSSEEWDGKVPLHRSYGVKRRATPLWDRIRWILIRIVAGIFVFGVIGVGVFATVMAFVYGGLLLRVGMASILISLLAFRPIRLLWKRWHFVLRLKKRCRELGYALRFQCGFWRALCSRKQDRLHLTVEGKKKIYAVQYFKVVKYHTFLTFRNPGTVTVTTGMGTNAMKLLIGLKEKHRERSFRIPLPTADGGKRVIPVLLLNPVPHSIFTYDEDGQKYATGTGAVIHGVTLYSGSGFLSHLERESQE